MKRIGLPTPGAGVFLLIGMFVALVFWTACQSGLDAGDLQEQYEKVNRVSRRWMDTVAVADAEMFDAEMYEYLCLELVLERELLRDMLLETSRAKDGWHEEELAEWHGYWRYYANLRNEQDKCSLSD